MSPELERLIALQQIETRAAEAAARIASAPGEIEALDAKLTASRAAVADARQAVADNQTARRSLDKDLIAAQQRLSKYKEQLMAVKTNAEYHAMQHQLTAVQEDIGRIEELVLVNMMEADEQAGRVKAAETALKADEAALSKERATIEAEVAEKRSALDESDKARAAIVPELDANTLMTFQRVLKVRQGLAVVPAVNGHCSECHVRLRPQVFNTIIRNESLIQCDHCQRILYYAGPRERSAEGHAAIDAAGQRQTDYDRPNS